MIVRKLKQACRLGGGFFADAYSLFVIDIVMAILAELHAEDPKGIGYSESTKGSLASATSFGAVVGMLTFGVLGDHLGRRVGVLTTGTLVTVGSFLSACCFRSSAFPLTSQLFFCLFVLGVGIGGEYPLSASIASEGAQQATRGRTIVGVFSMQGFGMLFSSLLAYIVLKSGASLEFTWRFILAVGTVPALCALYFRFSMPESAAFVSARRKRRAAMADEAPTQRSCCSKLVDKARKIARDISMFKTALLGTALSWCLLDITFYGTGEFKHVVSQAIFPEERAMAANDKMAADALFGLAISALALPGYFCSFCFIDRVGRWSLQVFGFGMMAIFYTGMGIAVDSGASGGLNLALFSLTFFFVNFGPNCSTFVIPSEVFPTRVKATCHGISAAAGKTGAIIGAAGFPAALSAVGLSGVLYICVGFAVGGVAVTVLLLSKEFVDMAAQAETENVIVVPFGVKPSASFKSRVRSNFKSLRQLRGQPRRSRPAQDSQFKLLDHTTSADLDGAGADNGQGGGGDDEKDGRDEHMHDEAEVWVELAPGLSPVVVQNNSPVQAAAGGRHRRSSRRRASLRAAGRNGATQVSDVGDGKDSDNDNDNDGGGGGGGDGGGGGGRSPGLSALSSQVRKSLELDTVPLEL